MAQIETAMVLAAGLGTRMRPLTDRIPKPLVTLGGRTLLDHVLDRLAAAGIGRAVVNVHHLADQIEAHLKTRAEPAITISDERGAILETGGGVLKALPVLGGSPFMVHNSNSVWTEGARSNLRLLMEAWAPRRMDGLLLLARRNSSIGYDGRGDYHMDASGRLSAQERQRGDALRIRRRLDPEAAAFRGRHGTGVFAGQDFRPGRRAECAPRRGARRNLDACGHAGSVDRGGEPSQ